MAVLTLRVTDPATGRTQRIARGRSLEEIARRDPGLTQRPGWGALMEAWQRYRREHPERFPFDRPQLSVQGFQQGVEIIHDNDRVVVRIRETDDEGNEQVNEYEGESLEQIKREHPEIADRLSGFRFELRVGPPQWFRGRNPLDRLPVPPSPPVVTPRDVDQGPRLGVTIVTVKPALAAQLQLPEGRGVLVDAVEPGSQAEALGLERFDVILVIDDHVVRDLDEAGDRLTAAARQEAPLTLEIVRRAQRMTLSR
jgi:hypothetical protein